MLHGVVAGAWATWVGWWHLHRQLLKAARFVRNAALGKAWRSWKQAHLLCKVAKAATQYTRNLLAKSVAKLAANVADAKSARKSTRTAMLFAFGKVSARYFDIWRRAARVLPVARRLRARVFARAAYGCLIGWRDFSRQRSMLLAKGQRLQASLGVNTLARLYGLWRTLYRVRVYMGEYNATRGRCQGEGLALRRHLRRDAHGQQAQGFHRLVRTDGRATRSACRVPGEAAATAPSGALRRPNGAPAPLPDDAGPGACDVSRNQRLGLRLIGTSDRSHNYESTWCGTRKSLLSYL